MRTKGEIIAERIVKELNRLILEELGIADDVRQIVNELMPQIKDAVSLHLKESNYTDRLGEPFDSHVKESLSSISTTIFGQKLSISIVNFNWEQYTCLPQQVGELALPQRLEKNPS